MLKKFDENIEITPENIDKVSRTAVEILTAGKAEHKKIVSVRLSLETVLVTLMEKGVKNAVISISKFLGRWRLIVESKGEKFNPFSDIDTDEDKSGFDFVKRISSILNDSQTKTDYTRRNDSNIITWILPRKHLNSIVQNLIAIAAAVLFTLALSHVSAETKDFIVDNFITPTFNSFISLLSALASVMIFLSIVSSISRMGDLSSFGKRGRTTIGILLTFTFLSTYFYVIVTLLLTGILSLTGVSTDLSTIISAFYKVILNIIPSDIISPFVNKNTLQLSFLAVSTGLIILVLGGKTKSLLKVIEDLNILIMKGISALCRLLPAAIFLSVSSLLLQDDNIDFSKIWKMILTLSLLSIVSSLAILLFTSRKLKIPFRKLLKDCLPIGLNAFFTASSFACLDMLKNFSVKKYKRDEKNFDFIFSMAQLFFTLNSTANYFIEGFFLMQIFGLNISVSQLIIALIIVILFAIATPPIPGGSIVIWNSLLTLYGLPTEALSIVISIDIFTDMITTGTKMFVTGPVILYTDDRLQKIQS